MTKVRGELPPETKEDEVVAKVLPDGVTKPPSIFDETEDSSNTELVFGLIVGIGCFLILALVVFFCKCCKPVEGKQKLHVLDEEATPSKINKISIVNDQSSR